MPRIRQKGCLLGHIKRVIRTGILLAILSQKAFPITQDSLYTGYNRGLNTDAWHGGFVFEKLFSSGRMFNISEAFSSSRLRVTPSLNKWKDQQNLVLNFSQRLTNRLSMNFLGSSHLFTDKQSGYRNDIRTHILGLGMSYSGNHIQIPIFLGLKDDRRFDQEDRGMNYRTGLHMPYFRFGEYENRFNANYEGDNLRKRVNNSFSMAYAINRQFYAETSDTLMLSLNHQRRDYYVSETGIIESREEKNQGVENRLTYRLASGFLCNLKGGISSRTLDIGLINGPQKGRTRERKDFNTTGEIHFHYKRPSFQGNLSLSYRSTEQKYTLVEISSPSPFQSSSLLSTPDNQAAFTTLSFQGGWKFLAADSLFLSCHLQRFRYDTPDPDNFDDRDELRYWLILQEVHTFSPYLQLNLSLHLNLLHFVYIYGEQSANNNWTRIIRLNSSVTWRPTPKWRTTQSAEVLANYVDYDFESYFTSVRSFLYRQLRLEDSTRVDLSERLSFHLFYRLELDENGKLIWDQWLEQKLIDRHSHTLSINLDYQPWKTFSINPGYSYFSRRSYRYKPNVGAIPQKEINLDFRSYGPFLKISYQSDRLRFFLTGSKIFTKNMNVDRQSITRIEMRMNWII